MKRKSLLNLLNTTVKCVAKSYNIKPSFIKDDPQHYKKYIKDMFNFIKNPELHYLKKKNNK